MIYSPETFAANLIARAILHALYAPLRLIYMIGTASAQVAEKISRPIGRMLERLGSES